MIIFWTNSPRGLLRVSAAGGEPQAITTPVGSSFHHWPEVLPGGAGVPFTVSTTSPTINSDDQIALLDLVTAGSTSASPDAPDSPSGRKQRWMPGWVAPDTHAVRS